MLLSNSGKAARICTIYQGTWTNCSWHIGIIRTAFRKARNQNNLFTIAVLKHFSTGCITIQECHLNAEDLLLWWLLDTHFPSHASTSKRSGTEWVTSALEIISTLPNEKGFMNITKEMSKVSCHYLSNWIAIMDGYPETSHWRNKEEITQLSELLPHTSFPFKSHILDLLGEILDMK